MAPLVGSTFRSITYRSPFFSASSLAMRSAATFTLLAKDGAARRGRLELTHGVVETPCFMPVGTTATVKALTPGDLERAGAQIVLANTYHLWLRP